MKVITEQECIRRYKLVQELEQAREHQRPIELSYCEPMKVHFIEGDMLGSLTFKVIGDAETTHTVPIEYLEVAVNNPQLLRILVCL